MAETWVINESPNATFNTFSIDFTSNNEEYNELYFDLNFAQDGSIWYGVANEVYNGSNWTNQAYRTITFDASPTGTLLTWLQANAVKQGPEQITIDLTTLSGWSGLSDGNHSITVKAKATGYRDSEASQAVSVTKAPAGYSVTITTGGVPAFEGAAGYSFDDGATWTYIPVSDPPGESQTVTLSGVTQIKLRSNGSPAAIISTILGLNLRNTPTIISDNIILTQDVDDIILRGSF